MEGNFDSSAPNQGKFSTPPGGAMEAKEGDETTFQSSSYNASRRVSRVCVGDPRGSNFPTRGALTSEASRRFSHFQLGWPVVHDNSDQKKNIGIPGSSSKETSRPQDRDLRLLRASLIRKSNPSAVKWPVSSTISPLESQSIGMHQPSDAYAGL